MTGVVEANLVKGKGNGNWLRTGRALGAHGGDVDHGVELCCLGGGVLRRGEGVKSPSSSDATMPKSAKHLKSRLPVETA